VRHSLIYLSVLCVLASADQGRAATFTVTTSLDLLDTAIGDGLCRTSEGQTCSLRAAIQESNALGGSHTIRLGGGPYRLTLQEPGANDPDEDAAATGDLDVTADILVESTSATLRRIQVAFNELIGPPADRIFHVLPGGDLTLIGLSLEDGVATSASTSRGGAILNEGTLHVSDCEFDANDATVGGAIYNDDFASLDVDSSTFTNNGATSGGGAIFGDAAGFVDLENSTFSSNDGPDVLRLENIGEATLSHLTIHANAGAGIVTNLSQTIFVDVISSIVSGSSGAECSFSGAVTLDSLTSLASDDSCGFAATGGFDSTDPELGPLADNGGATLTHLPADTSPARDNASPLAPCPPEDQRGTLRPDGDGGLGDCDIGAVELLPEPGSEVLGLAALLAARALARRRA
jgi:predicted outer membrane repeat protein